MDTGFAGRALIAEMVRLDGDLRKAVLAKADMSELQNVLDAQGHVNMYHSGLELVARGVTSAAELRRVCGLTENGR